VTAADLVSWSDDVWVAVTVAVDGSDVTGPPVGGVPDDVALLTIVPASMSAWVTEYDAVHVMETPVASDELGQLIVSAGAAGAVKVSATETLVSVTLPVFFTTNE
jgi:hypothetical protein